MRGGSSGVIFHVGKGDIGVGLRGVDNTDGNKIICSRGVLARHHVLGRRGLSEMAKNEFPVECFVRS